MPSDNANEPGREQDPPRASDPDHAGELGREIPVRRSRLRDLPPSIAPPTGVVAYRGIWNRPDRPKLVGFICWITVAAGYLAFGLKGGTLPRYFMDMRWVNPNYVAPALTRGQFATEVFLIIADMGLGLFAVAVGLAALTMREWGRRGLIYYAIVALVLGVLKAIYQFSNFDAALEQSLAASTQPIDRATVGNREFFVMLTATAMMAVWPLLVLWIATRPHIRRAFARANGQQLADDADGFSSPAA